MPDFELFKGNTKQVFKMFRRDNVLVVFTVLLAIVLGICIAAISFFYSSIQNTDKIQSGIFIKGINVSGLTKQEAITVVGNELSKQMNDHLELSYNSITYYVEIEQIGAKFDIEESVNYAFNVAKKGSFTENINQYFDVMFRNINIEPKLIYNEDALNEYLQTIEANLPDQIIQSSYYIDDDRLVIANGTNGAGIVFDELKDLIVDALEDVSYSNSKIVIPTYVTYPDPIDVDAIHNEVFRNVENAYYTTNPYVIIPEITGVDFNIDEMREKIEENPFAEEYAVDLIYTKADITVKDFGEEAFPNLLGSFSTNYVASNVDRTTNLRLAASKINGTVVLPGEIFSYNKVVGKRTIDAGYKNAAIYQDGGVVDGLGGGICQISTTLYNAAIDAGMLIEERRNHMFVPSYVSGGKDATVVWGSTDFKFENRRDYPVKITASVSGGVAKVSIWGLKTDEEYDIYDLSIESRTVKSTDTSLVVESYRVYKDSNGNVVKRDKLYTDTYKKQ